MSRTEELRLKGRVGSAGRPRAGRWRRFVPRFTLRALLFATSIIAVELSVFRQMPDMRPGAFEFVVGAITLACAAFVSYEGLRRGATARSNICRAALVSGLAVLGLYILESIPHWRHLAGMRDCAVPGWEAAEAWAGVAIAMVGAFVGGAVASIFTLGAAINRGPGAAPLHSLDASETDIVDLAHLSTATELRVLTLEDCKWLRDISAIGKLPRLVELSLSGCEALSDLGALAGAERLTRLTLDGLGAWNGDLRPIGRCPNLVYLSTMWAARVVDLAPLANLRRLESLDLTGCTAVTDLRPLAGSKALRLLNLAGLRGARRL